MKKTTLSLAIGLILFSSHSSVYAIEDPALSNESGSENKSSGENDYPPYPGDATNGELPPTDIDYPPFPDDGENLADGESPQYPAGTATGELPPSDIYYPPRTEDGDLAPEGYFPPPQPPHIEDFGLSHEQLDSFDATEISKIDPDAFQTFKPVDFAHIPPEAMNGLTSEQFKKFNRETLEVLSEQQFQQLPPTLMGDLDPEKIGSFRPDIVKQFRPEHFNQFKPEQFAQVDRKDIFRMIANSDPEYIKPEHFHDILPSGWTMTEDGLMQLPEGESFALPPIPKRANLSPHVIFPDEIPDLTKGLGLGGQGEPLLKGLNQALAGANLSQFDIQQDDKGIMQVKGSEIYEGTNLAFIPDMDNMKQGDKNSVPGVSQDERGLFVLTTPDGQIIPIRPVPKDISAIKDLIPEEGGEVKLGKDGDVFLNIPERDGKQVGIFSPIINPAPDGMKPGIHFPEDPTGLEPALIVYEDGTSQTMNPTVPSPEDFIAKAKEFEGVDETQFNGDGSISLDYKGQPIKLKPTFNVTMESIPENTEKVEPSITLLDGGILEYRYQQGDQITVFTVNINIK